MQVKIFEPEYSMKSCENKINQWLKANSDKKIIDIKIISEGSGMRSCAMIIYDSEALASQGQAESVKGQFV